MFEVSLSPSLYCGFSIGHQCNQIALSTNSITLTHNGLTNNQSISIFLHNQTINFTTNLCSIISIQPSNHSKRSITTTIDEEDQTMLSTPSSPVGSKHRINSSRAGRRDASHDTALLNIDACSSPRRSGEILAISSSPY